MAECRSGIYFLTSFFLPIAERPTRPEPSKSMAAGSGTDIMTPSISIKLASAFPTIRINPQTNKKSMTPNFFIFIASFLDWAELLDSADDLLLNFDVKT
jgi:hypothetical protein